MYLFLNENFSQGMIAMLFSFLIYVINNIIINARGHNSIFNEYLEDLGVYLTFVLTTIIYGVHYYKDNILTLGVLMFYSMCFVLALGRNWVSHLKNSTGFPPALNGIFFPLLYFVYIFYLGDTGSSVFLFYYVIVGILSVSSVNFLGYKEVGSSNIIEKKRV